MKDYKYTRTLSVKKVMSGTLDAEAMTVAGEEAEFSIADELKDFNGVTVSITVAAKSEEDLSE